MHTPAHRIYELVSDATGERYVGVCRDGVNPTKQPSGELRKWLARLPGPPRIDTTFLPLSLLKNDESQIIAESRREQIRANGALIEPARRQKRDDGGRFAKK